ncbi:MAG: hypothetical protein EOO41_00945 [Methanobacteriota archaeon]|nr:MAG: hypothetical protein EOO41_00945 [Euryarchaeota archaeon]
MISTAVVTSMRSAAFHKRQRLLGSIIVAKAGLSGPNAAAEAAALLQSSAKILNSMMLTCRPIATEVALLNQHPSEDAIDVVRTYRSAQHSARVEAPVRSGGGGTGAVPHSATSRDDTTLARAPAPAVPQLCTLPGAVLEQPTRIALPSARYQAPADARRDHDETVVAFAHTGLHPPSPLGASAPSARSLLTQDGSLAVVAAAAAGRLDARESTVSHNSVSVSASSTPAADAAHSRTTSSRDEQLSSHGSDRSLLLGQAAAADTPRSPTSRYGFSVSVVPMTGILRYEQHTQRPVLLSMSGGLQPVPLEALPSKTSAEHSSVSGPLATSSSHTMTQVSAAGTGAAGTAHTDVTADGDGHAAQGTPERAASGRHARDQAVRTMSAQCVLASQPNGSGSSASSPQFYPPRVSPTRGPAIASPTAAGIDSSLPTSMLSGASSPTGASSPRTAAFEQLRHAMPLLLPHSGSLAWRASQEPASGRKSSSRTALDAASSHPGTHTSSIIGNDVGGSGSVQMQYHRPEHLVLGAGALQASSASAQAASASSSGMGVSHVPSHLLRSNSMQRSRGLGTGSQTVITGSFMFARGGEDTADGTIPEYPMVTDQERRALHMLEKYGLCPRTGTGAMRMFGLTLLPWLLPLTISMSFYSVRTPPPCTELYCAHRCSSGSKKNPCIVLIPASCSRTPSKPPT